MVKWQRTVFQCFNLSKHQAPLEERSTPPHVSAEDGESVRQGRPYKASLAWPALPAFPCSRFPVFTARWLRDTPRLSVDIRGGTPKMEKETSSSGFGVGGVGGVGGGGGGRN